MPDVPPIRIVTLDRSSGGGAAVACNLALAAHRFPRVLGFDEASPWTLIPRNWANPKLLRSGRYVLMPQNAWPWSGEVSGFRPRRRRLGLRLASEVSMRRAAGIIRIGGAIPSIGRPLGDPLLHVLDEGFEVALETAWQGPSQLIRHGGFVCIGSITTYRGLDTLVQAYGLYKRGHGALPLTIAGPGPYWPRVDLPPGLTLRPGPLSRSEVLAAFRDAAAAVFPSTVETSSMSVMEAEEVGKAVIVSDIQGHRDVASCASFFQLGDAETIASLLHSAEAKLPDRVLKEPQGFASREARAHDRSMWCQHLVDRLGGLDGVDLP
jgi:glycosyltransferase involved in cell wall biosynthesis